VRYLGDNEPDRERQRSAAGCRAGDPETWRPGGKRQASDEGAVAAMAPVSFVTAALPPGGRGSMPPSSLYGAAGAGWLAIAGAERI